MMDELTEKFEKIKKSKDPDEINDFLIDIGNNPKSEHLIIIEYFIENYDSVLYSQIKLNLIYILGQIGLNQSLNNKYLDFLIEEYFSSDRWIRNEILSALYKIANRTKLSKKVFDILKYAILDDYLPISINATKALLLYENIPNDTFKKIFRLLQTQDVSLQDQISNVLKKFIKNEYHLYELLNDSENYRIFTKKAFRFLLLTFFNSAMSLSNLESFRKLIESSKWDINNKKIFINEIDTYQKILLRNT
ncbi:MAG: hypothetical protein ACFFDK_16735 [Promethearchaeota archaeon]